MEVSQSEAELLELFGDRKLAKAAAKGKMSREMQDALVEAKATIEADLTPDQELIAAARAKKRLTEAASAELGLDASFFDYSKKLTPHQRKTKAKSVVRRRLEKKTRRAQRRRK